MSICGADDVLPWPSCDRMDPPQEHSPIRWNETRDRFGKFQRAFFGCETCERALGHMEAA